MSHYRQAPPKSARTAACSLCGVLSPQDKMSFAPSGKGLLCERCASREKVLTYEHEGEQEERKQQRGRLVTLGIVLFFFFGLPGLFLFIVSRF